MGGTGRKLALVAKLESVPATILGLDYEEIDIEKVTKILSLYNISFSKALSDNQLIHFLVQLGWELDDVEKVTIKTWLEDDNMGTKGELEAYLKESKKPNIEFSPVVQYSLYGERCDTCEAKFTNESFPTRNPMIACRHETRSCNDCTRKLIDHQILEAPKLEVECPICPVRLSEEKIKYYASEHAYETRIALRRHPGFTKCTNKHCYHAQVHYEGVEQPIMVCQSCGFRTCFYHQVPWHYGENCEEYRQRHRRQLKRLQRVHTDRGDSEM